MTQVDEGPESPSAPGVLMVGVPSAGEVLAERYQLQEHVNDDAFGRQVWRGIDVVLRRPIAVVLRYPGGSAAVEMLDAAVKASRVVHPHLVDVYDAIDEGNRAYVVREWVDGDSLRGQVSHGVLDPDRATTVVAAVTRAVAAIHASGMAHGNVHPGTVLIASDARVVLTDARADESAAPDADVRAIGGVLYYALTGRWPRLEAGRKSLPDAVRDPAGIPAAPRQVRGGVPEHLSDLAMGLLDLQAAPPPAAVLAAEFNRLETEQDTELFSAGGPFDLGRRPSPDPGPAAPHRPIGRKIAVGIAGLVALALLGFTLAIKFMPGSAEGGAQSPPSPVATATGGSGPSEQPVAKPVQVPLAADQVRIIDPKGDRGEEIQGVGATVDGDPDTAWKTDHYRSSPHFGKLKPGMGVLIDLGSTKQVSSVKVEMLWPGATVDLRSGTINPPSTSDGDAKVLSEYTVVGAEKTDAGSTVVFNGPTDPVRYLMVWISKLPPAPDDPTQYQEGIDEIEVFANE